MKKFVILMSLFVNQSLFADDLKVGTIQFKTGLTYTEKQTDQYQINDILENTSYYAGKAAIGSENCGESIYFVDDKNELKLQIVRRNPLSSNYESAVIEHKLISTDSMVQDFSSLDGREFISILIKTNDQTLVRCRYTKTHESFK